MPELPNRPDLNRLRRQARELLRAATSGEPEAIRRLRVVSDRVTLSASQLAIAREYGYASWCQLKTEVEQRRSLEQPLAGFVSTEQGPKAITAPEERRSFGGASSIELTACVLSPRLLLVGADSAMLEASVTPSGDGRMPLAGPRFLERRHGQPQMRAIRKWLGSAFDDLTAVDDRGSSYGLRGRNWSGGGRIDQSR